MSRTSRSNVSGMKKNEMVSKQSIMESKYGLMHSTECVIKSRNVCLQLLSGCLTKTASERALYFLSRHIDRLSVDVKSVS